MNQKIAFSFGKNWQKFLKSLNDHRFKNARLSLTTFLGLDSFQGKSFLDVGCGSGLFSYSAFNLGAERVVSFDVDPFSVECCRYLHQKANRPKNWEIHQGSALDPEFLSGLGTFDIVYAWGVLHHTGQMWQAIKNSALRAAPGGFFYLAVYNDVKGVGGSQFWLRLKKLYNVSPAPLKFFLEVLYMFVYCLRRLCQFKNPVTDIRSYISKRGMDWKVDIVDWLGGYPYEFASVEETFRFIRTHFPDFHLVNLMTTEGVGSNWYLFVNSPLEKKEVLFPSGIKRYPEE